MTNLLDLVLYSFLAGCLEWYRDAILGNFTRFPHLFLSILLTYIFIQLFCVFIPPLRKFLNVFALPFRYMHVWLHIDAANKIQKSNDGSKTKTQTSISLWTPMRGKDSINISLEVYSTRDALKIASAPLKGAIALLFFIVLSSPILAKLGLFGLILHIYLIFSCFGVALPSLSDYSFVYQGAMTYPGSFSPFYLLWVYFIFAISGYITLKRTSSAVSAIIDGLLFSSIYLIALFILAKIVKPKVNDKWKNILFFNSRSSPSTIENKSS